ncbi:AAA family ATPase [Micromonospora cremea]|uniref:Part of AAA domain-containing protein n=1 Tax=Micromonospora cremea TaxID=709881 RepID=A0A1N6ANW0_9ACTN|nr:AAA family ATPase [Micromonospora cremea]SIN35723.1 Part of AAA domain-containing protein [Micromonospora cremea]
MTLGRKQLDLEDERTAQKRYRKKMQDKVVWPVAHYGPKGTAKTGNGAPRRSVMSSGQLVGRVALTMPDEDVLDGQADFYIGESYADLDGVKVYSWVSDVACTFFRGSRHHEFCEDVAVIRAFVYRLDEIVDFHDEEIADEIPVQPFRKRTLTVPTAPGRTGPRRPPTPPLVAPQPPALPSVAPRSAPAHFVPTQPTQPATSAQPVRPAVPTARAAAGAGRAAPPPVRAGDLLRAQLTAPRTKSLAPVLATLQPDQYDLVTVPAMDSMIIEGQPGTGKTIVASHRAAYLVSDDTPGEKSLDGDILLVGPTSGYSQYVQAVIDRLTGGSERVRVVSLPELMRHLLDLRREPGGPISQSWRDVDKDLAMFVRAAVTRMKASGITPTPDNVYEHLRRNGTSGHPVTRDSEWAVYLRSLPPVRDARTMRAHTPLLATIEWEAAKPRDLGGIEHIIVDEAQDVTPLEWLLLASMNEAHAWTLIGDLNQRRSDHTLASWAQVLDLLAVPNGDPPVRRLERGYRSTRPILEYANRLLPAAERAILAFQEEGPEPTVEKCQQSGLGATVLRHVTRLQAAYLQGTFAIITADPKAVETMLRLVGWAKSRSDPFTWQHSGREVTVAHPDTARGLEFDGVVVVEPADFPQNLGRQGPLYTALTRPNRELTVVHTKPLPERLRKR